MTEGEGHAGGIAGSGKGGIDEDAIRSKFQRSSSMRGGTEACVDDDGDSGLLDDYFQLAARFEAPVGTNGGAEGHDGGRADFLKAFGKDGVGIDVGEDGEAFLDEDFSGGKRFNGVGKEIAGIGMDFEFDPFGQSGGGGEAGEANGFPGVHGAAGVGEDKVFFRVDEVEDVGVGVVLAGEVGAAEGDGDDFGAAGFEALGHGLVGGELAGADEKS